MAAQGALIVSGPGGTIEIKGRRRLENAKVFEAMLTDLSNRLTSNLNQHKTIVIADLDISQNKLTHEQFESLFMTLGVAGVKVQRFRMFGCATLNDE
ncbi:unnamed protein product, partial [Polarella glacialis]